MTFLDLINSLFENLFLTISQSWILQVFFALWLLVAFSNKERRQIFINNISYFLRMPLTYDDKSGETFTFYGDNTPIYPSSMFEAAYIGLKNGLVKPAKEIKKIIYNVQHNLTKDFDWNTILQGLFLAGFIYADIVGGINIISLVPGLITWSVPPWLGEYSITVMAGTILSVIVSGMMVGNLFGNEQNDAGTNEDKDFSTGLIIRKVITILLLISSFLTIIGINLLKLPVFVRFFTDESIRIIEGISGVFLHVVVMFNAAMATFLLEKKGLSGLKILGLLVLFPLFILLVLISFLFDLIANVGPLSLDIIVRIIFVTLNFIAYITLAPLDTSVYLLGNLFLKKKPVND